MKEQILTNALFEVLTSDNAFKDVMFSNMSLYPQEDIELIEYSVLKTAIQLNGNEAANIKKHTGIDLYSKGASILAEVFLKDSLCHSIKFQEKYNEIQEFKSLKDISDQAPNYKVIIVSSPDLLYGLIEEFRDKFGYQPQKERDSRPIVDDSRLIIDEAYKNSAFTLYYAPALSPNKIYMFKGNVCEFELIEKYNPVYEEILCEPGTSSGFINLELSAEFSIPIRKGLIFQK
jgi:hypothetical protein